MPQSFKAETTDAREAAGQIAAARDALNAGRLDDAEQQFRLLIGSALADEAQKGLGDVFLRKGRLSNAIEAYRLALGQRPDWPEVENNLGSVYKMQGDRGTAELHYRRALSLDRGLSSAGNNLGVLLAEAGQFDEALAWFQEALLGPSPVREARRNLGKALFQLERTEEARREFERALDEDPQDADTLAAMAKVSRATGEPKRALELACEALRLRPGFGEAYLEAGLAALELDHGEQALSYCRTAVELNLNNAAAHEALGSALVGCGMPLDAEHHFRRAIALAPDLASAYIKLGRLDEDRDQFADAEESYRKAVAANPKHALAFTHLGHLALKQKKPSDALAHFERAKELRPARAATHSNLASALNELGRHQDAANACRTAISLDPKLAEAHQNLGATLQTLGDLDEARLCYERALSLKPELVSAICSLANLATESAQKTLPTIIKLLDSSKLDTAAKPQLYFAQARLYEKLGEYDAAFGAAVAAQAIQGERQTYEPEKFEQFTTDIIKTFTAQFFAKRRSFGAVNERPIFVLGMPRSGTTLIEQVLASHPRVAGGGELPILAEIATNLRRWSRSDQPFPQGVVNLNEPEVLRLAGAYRRRTRTLAGPIKRVTDKMTSNIFYLGLVALLFPGAKIVYCRRNLFDLFISNYFTSFRMPLPYTTGQREFAHFYEHHENLFNHWCRELPLEIHVIQYETFVSAQEPATRALLEYCDLEWEPRCLEFHLTQRPIRTSSDTQVRRPLYQSSAGRAAPYRSHLRELEAALGSLAG